MAHAKAVDPTATTGGGLLGAFDRGLHWIEKGLALASGFGIFALMMIGVVQILSRKFLNLPIFGYIDMVEIAMAFLVFLGLSYTERLGGHIRMELIVAKLKGRALWLFEIIGVTCGLIIVGVLTVFSWQHAMRAYNSGDSSIDAQFQLWPSKMVVSISLGLLFLRLLVSLWAYIRLLISPDAAQVAVIEVVDSEEQARREAEAALQATLGDDPGLAAPAAAGPATLNSSRTNASSGPQS
ncbi:MAG TPA: TRAP transporter small permease [Hyphomicrobiaceae bacterium]|nr:TRAP transporter small permease [Hyphomicrobiaceae bacterium]